MGIRGWWQRTKVTMSRRKSLGECEVRVGESFAFLQKKKRPKA